MSNLLGKVCVCVSARARARVCECERAHDGAGPIDGLSIVCGKKTSLSICYCCGIKILPVPTATCVRVQQPPVQLVSTTQYNYK